jgi:L,D-peptidoglycan transpeptidase YkuD (ErfK/YbiS/YcfS/YnhG family)
MVTNDNPNSIQVKIELFEKNNNWIKKDILINGVLGLKGFAPINKKREGDYKTPVGIYSLGLAFGYEKNVITKLEYRQLTDDDYWVDDPNAPNYNQWVIGKPNVKSFEKMKRNDNLYKYGIVVNYNMNPVIKWKGSAVFFHLWRGPNLGTGGCIGLSEKDILIILKWLDREKKPLVILGTNSDLDKLIF